VMFPPTALATADFLRELDDRSKWDDRLDYLSQVDLSILADEAAKVRMKENLEWLKHRDPLNLTQHMVKLENLPEVEAFCRKKANHFVSQNSFYFGGRKTHLLAGLTCCFLDLDYYKLDDGEIKEMLNIDDLAVDKIINICTESKWAPPSQIVRTGRGLLVRWIFDEFLPGGALPRWKHVQAKLYALFQTFNSDNRALDASRIFRVIGSINPKSGFLVREIFGGTKINFDDLANVVLDMPRLDQTTRQAFKSLREAIDKDPNRGYVLSSPIRLIPAIQAAQHSSLRTRRWADGVCHDMLRLVELRKDMHGYRESTVFIYLNFKLRGGWTPNEDEYKNEARRVALLVSGEDLAAEVESSVSTLFRKWDANRGDDLKSTYRYSRATLISDFDITPAEQQSMRMLKTKVVVLRKPQCKETEHQQAYKYFADGMTKASIAKLLKISKSTVRAWFAHNQRTSNAQDQNSWY
jgi:DNA-binding transcriptional regulator YiaG